jgi:hypothetical protein
MENQKEGRKSCLLLRLPWAADNFENPRSADRVGAEEGCPSECGKKSFPFLNGA